MKRLLLTFGALMALSGMASAATPCVAQPPKDFQGTIQAAAPGSTSVAANYFQQNGCTWAGADLNGTDAWIVDIGGLVGTGTISANIAAGFLTTMSSYFLDDKCQPIGDPVLYGMSGDSYAVNFPAGAKWMVTQVGYEGGSQPYPAANVEISMRFDGKSCPIKKRKPRR